MSEEVAAIGSQPAISAPIRCGLSPECNAYRVQCGRYAHSGDWRRTKPLFLRDQTSRCGPEVQFWVAWWQEASMILLRYGVHQSRFTRNRYYIWKAVDGLPGGDLQEWSPVLIHLFLRKRSNNTAGNDLSMNAFWSIRISRPGGERNARKKLRPGSELKSSQVGAGAMNSISTRPATRASYWRAQSSASAERQSCRTRITFRWVRSHREMPQGNGHASLRRNGTLPLF